MTVLALGLSTLAASSLRVAIGGTDRTSTIWQSSSALLSKPAAGGGFGAVVVVTLLQLRGSLTLFNTLDTATLQSTLRSNLAGTGSGSVTVLGFNIQGAVHAGSSRFMTGNSALASTLWQSSTSICGKSRGRGRPHQSSTCIGLTVPSSLLISTLTRAVSYDVFLPTSVLRTNAALTGSMTVTVLGRPGQKFEGSVGCRLLQTTAECTFWLASSCLFIKSAAVKFSAGLIVVSGAPGFSSSISSVLSVDGTASSSAVATNIQRSGAASITVLGSSFFSSTPFRVAGTIGAATAWGSSSAVLCRSSQSLASRFVGRAVWATGVVRSVSTLTAAISIDVSAFSTAVQSNLAVLLLPPHPSRSKIFFLNYTHYFLPDPFPTRTDHWCTKCYVAVWEHWGCIVPPSKGGLWRGSF